MVRHSVLQHAVMGLRPRWCANMYRMVDHGSVTPLYVQLADLITRKIENGDYAPGQRLPSADGLSEEYDIAPNTALKALRLLRERGLVEMSNGRGTYVTRKPG